CMPAEDGEDFMSTKRTRNASGSGHVERFQEAAPVSVGDGAATPTDNRDGTKGAPPSNTAPDNCNPEYFQPLRWGIDSLYLSYPGQLLESTEDKLKELKLLAQCRDDLAALAQYPIQEHCFEVK